MIVPMQSRDAFLATTPAVGDPQRLAADALLLLRSGGGDGPMLMERLAAWIVAAATRAADVSRCHLHRSRTRRMTDPPRNNAPNTRGRPFEPGNPGRPKGARHRITRAAEALLDGETEALTRKAIELALAGDGMALRLCLERILPPRKERPVDIELPSLTGAKDAVAASAALLAAVAGGEIAPGEATRDRQAAGAAPAGDRGARPGNPPGGIGGAATMTDRAMERRVCAVEKRLGVTGRPLEQLSDLDLLGAIEAVSQHLAAAGNTDAADTLAQHDAQEAALRAFWERADMTGRQQPGAGGRRALALPARPSAMARGDPRAGRAALGGERGRAVAEDRRVRMSGEQDMLSRLQHRIERLEGGDRGSRVIVVKVGHLDGDDDSIVADALAEAGITRLPNDLLVRVLNFSADRLDPPASVVAVHAQGAGR